MLTVDHINGGGNQHKKRVGPPESVHREILKDPDAKKKYRTLCLGCNDALPLYGSERALKAAIRREHERIGKLYRLRNP